MITPYLQDPDFVLYQGDALSVLRELPDESVDCCVTSPPYWNLRDYGTGEWERPEGWSDEARAAAAEDAVGWLSCPMTRDDAEEIKEIYADENVTWRGLAQEFGVRHSFDWAGNQLAGMDLWLAAQTLLDEMWDDDPEHEHDTKPARGGRGGSGSPGKQTAGAFPSEFGAHECKCGARRVDHQLGLEETPDLYLARMVEVFREVRRVLAKHGTCWVNMGDSYVSTAPGTRDKADSGTSEKLTTSERFFDLAEVRGNRTRPKTPLGLKPKDLVMMPAELALALRADGWYLRSEIVWSKLNPMPESVTDRPTKAHEMIYLLSKSPRYYFDQEAVRERYVQEDTKLVFRTGDRYIHTDPRGMDNSAASGPDGRRKTTVQGADGSIQHRDGERWPNGGRNIRSVWEIPTQPFPDAHFATFPEELVRRCILAGCPEQVCRVCGKPRERITSHEYDWYREPREDRVWRDTAGAPARSGSTKGLANKIVTTEGWTSCECADYRPGIVFDPFLGSGTTALVARKHGRHAIGIELKPDYCAMSAKRLAQQSLFAS